MRIETFWAGLILLNSGFIARITRIIVLKIMLAFALTGIFSFQAPSVSAAETEGLLSIVEQSCTKACVEGRGKAAFCKSYCGCVRGRVKALAGENDITSVLEDNNQQQMMIEQCSGETAVQFFSLSCKQKCKDAARCNEYCSCLEQQITGGKNFTEIGTFFIRLGKNEDQALSQLKGYEAACTKR